MQGELLREFLLQMSEPAFHTFTCRLMPTVPKEKVYGVRLPKLRKLAKRLAKEEGEDFFSISLADSFEETLLQGMVIGYLPCGLEKKLFYVKEFVPKIDNWSVCDSFCSGLKIAVSYPEEVWEFLQPYFHKDREFLQRFAVVMLLYYYVSPPYVKKSLKLLDGIQSEFYYVKMAVAWAVSVYFSVFPSETMDYLENCALDTFTYRKALQKMIELKQTDEKTKKAIQALRRQLSEKKEKDTEEKYL